MSTNQLRKRLWSWKWLVFSSLHFLYSLNRIIFIHSLDSCLFQIHNTSTRALTSTVHTATGRLLVSLQFRLLHTLNHLIFRLPAGPEPVSERKDSMNRRPSSLNLILLANQLLLNTPAA